MEDTPRPTEHAALTALQDAMQSGLTPKWPTVTRALLAACGAPAPFRPVQSHEPFAARNAATVALSRHKRKTPDSVSYRGF